MKTSAAQTLSITSDAFRHNDYIPTKYTCEGSNIHPSLRIGDIPPGTQSVALIVDDPDAPKGIFTHWVLWNIPPQSVINEAAAPGGTEGLNSYGKPGYKGPCPPSGTHRYFFKIYALDRQLELKEGAGKAELEKAMEGHVLAYGELIGLYQKNSI